MISEVYIMICMSCKEKIEFADKELQNWMAIHGKHSLIVDYNETYFNDKYGELTK